jgi:hypothetical protein
MFTDPNVINNIILAVVAISNMVTAFLAYKNHQAVQDVKKDIATVEKATNSMKDALVAATDKASRAEGMAAGLAQGRDEKSPCDQK